MSIVIANASVGVLNASYEALGNTKLGRAMALVIKGDAVIDEADHSRTIKSKGVEYPMPLVIRLLRFVHVPVVYAPEAFTKAGVLARDKHTCGYCGKKSGNGVVMTHDHILPRSRGGKDEWMNAITACLKCNGKKSNMTPEEAGMPLLFEPWIPKQFYYVGGKAKQKKKRKNR